MHQLPKLNGQMLFSKRSALPEISCVYFVFTSDSIFYIGRSLNLHQRFNTHNRRTQFAKLGDSLMVGWIKSPIDEIDEIELAFIDKLSPSLNRTKGGGSHWSLEQTKQRRAAAEILGKRIMTSSFTAVIDFALRYTMANFPDNPERTRLPATAEKPPRQSQ